MKLNAKTQFFLITFDFCIHSKKVVKFSFKRQKIFWVLVVSFMYLHGSYKRIIMHEKCGRPDSNGFQLK